MSQTCCRDCKGRIREHVASLLPFRVLEAVGPTPLIRAEEFRKNAVKILGWELWDDPNASKVPPAAAQPGSGNVDGSGGGV